MRTGLTVDERFHAHRPPSPHPERVERLVAIEAALTETGLITRTQAVPARAATRLELERVHAPAFLDGLDARVRNKSGWIDGDTYYSPGSLAAAELASGALVDQVQAVLGGTLDAGVALVRPPGHHATRDRAMGFCLLNHVAVAAASARALQKRVAIYDWDVHHGNGTEDIFLDDPDVLYVSTHESPQYPGTGAASERGRGRGLGATVNVPLGPGTGDEEYFAAYQEQVRPALVAFKPDLILLSAGYDAHRDDPLGGLELTEHVYDRVARDLLTIQPRLVAVLEGGYDLGALARCTTRLVEMLVSA